MWEKKKHIAIMVYECFSFFFFLHLQTIFRVYNHFNLKAFKYSYIVRFSMFNVQSLTKSKMLKFLNANRTAPANIASRTWFVETFSLIVVFKCLNVLQPSSIECVSLWLDNRFACDPPTNSIWILKCRQCLIQVL